MRIKFSKQSTGSFFSHICSFFFCGEISKVHEFSIDSNASLPFAMRTKMYTFNSNQIVRVQSFVAIVFCLRALSQVRPSIIKRIVVDMVHLFPIFTCKNYAMHPNSFIPLMSSHTKTSCMGIKLRFPIPLIEPVVVRSIYNGVLPLRKRDKSVRLVERLRNGVPLNRHLEHVRTSMRMSYQPHYIAYCWG